MQCFIAAGVVFVPVGVEDPADRTLVAEFINQSQKFSTAGLHAAIDQCESIAALEQHYVAAGAADQGEIVSDFAGLQRSISRNTAGRPARQGQYRGGGKGFDETAADGLCCFHYWCHVSYLAVATLGAARFGAPV